VTIEQAQAEMNVIARRLEQAYPETNKGWGVKVFPLQEGLFGNFRQILYPLFIAVAIVLLIACANIANLLLSRAATRQKEIAIRSAMGANRLRLLRQMLTESVLLAFSSGVLGLLLSLGGIKLFLALAPRWYPHGKLITIDGRVLVFTLAISLLTGIAFGLAPALRASRLQLNEALKEGGRTSGTDLRHGTRSVLVVAEVALAVVLLISAGLVLNTLFRVMHTEPGLNPANLFTLEFRMDGKRYIDWDQPVVAISPQMGILCQRVLERVNRLPGITSAALIDWAPMVGNWEDNHSRTFTILGRPVPVPSERPNVFYEAISPDYFRTMEIPFLKGRDFTGQDVEVTPWVAIINQELARQLWPEQNPIGQVITLDSLEERPRQIIGVVGNVKEFRLRDKPVPQIYVSYLQQPGHVAGSEMSRVHKSLVLRANSLSPEVMQTARKTVAELVQTSPIYGVATVRQLMSDSATLERLFSQLLGLFAGVALFLAAIGIYGVMSYSVSERNHEIGIRMALGARPEQVLKLVLRKGMVLACLGLVIGLMASFAVTRFFSRLLFGIQPHDPLTLALVSVFLISTAILATYIPARAATKVDPMVALRYE
jgi:predicted permease